MLKPRPARSLPALLATALLTAAAAAAPAPNIPWQVDLYPAYLQACKERKPLIVYFRLDYCPKCKGRCRQCARLEEALRSPEVRAFADKAVWVWQDAYTDDAGRNVGKLKKALGVDRYPFVTVLAAGPECIAEKGRVVGSYPAKELAEKLRICLAAPAARK